jgi:hypothetical protein
MAKRAFRQYKHPESVSVKAADSDRAMELSKAGAQLFGFSWINANRKVVRLFHEYGINPEHNQALGMEIATLMLTRDK